MTSQPPFVPGLAVPTSSPFSAFQSASPTTCQPASVDPLTAPSGLKLPGSAAWMASPRAASATPAINIGLSDLRLVFICSSSRYFFAAAGRAAGLLKNTNVP